MYRKWLKYQHHDNPRFSQVLWLATLKFCEGYFCALPVLREGNQLETSGFIPHEGEGWGGWRGGGGGSFSLVKSVKLWCVRSFVCLLATLQTVIYGFSEIFDLDRKWFINKDQLVKLWGIPNHRLNPGFQTGDGVGLVLGWGNVCQLATLLKLSMHFDEIYRISANFHWWLDYSKLCLDFSMPLKSELAEFCPWVPLVKIMWYL